MRIRRRGVHVVGIEFFGVEGNIGESATGKADVRLIGDMYADI